MAGMHPELALGASFAGDEAEVLVASTGNEEIAVSAAKVIDPDGFQGLNKSASELLCIGSLESERIIHPDDRQVLTKLLFSRPQNVRH